MLVIELTEPLLDAPQLVMLPIPVVLLKTSARSCSTSTPDPYAHLLSQPASTSRAPSYGPAFLEVLETMLVDDGELERVLRAGSRLWRGVVVSSGRSVEAWRRAGERLGAADDSVAVGKGKGRAVEVDQLGNDDGATASIQRSMRRRVLTLSAVSLPAGQPWSEVPFFSIGPSTTTGLLALSDMIPQRFCPARSAIIGTDTAGNTPALAQVILDHFADDDGGDDSLPLLYLTGDKNSSVLEETLAARSPPLPLEPLQVYATTPTAGFGEALNALLSALPPTPTDDRRRPWIAIFSPSALPLLLPVLRARSEGLDRWRYALIGPTTEQAWVEQTAQEDGALDWLVSPKPTAGALVSALRARDGL